jgi:hypothetical protein
MFNLENSITAWRQQLITGGIKTPAVLDELESHLRDSVEQQLRSGVTAQQAFDAATQRIGQAFALGHEFAKAEGIAGQRRKFLGSFGVVFALIYLFASTFALVNIEMNLNLRILGFSAVLVVVLLFCSFQFIGKLLPTVSRLRPGQTIQLACRLSAIFWIPSFFYLILPLFNFTLGPLVVAILWAIVPSVLLATVSSRLDAMANRKDFPAPAQPQS